jgi:YesN/AraC family two-component response regulator
VKGLEAAKRIRPDLVVTDIRMPGMDGLELIRQIKKRFPDAEAIIISGYDDFEYARTGLQLGVKDFLVKPVKRKALLDAAGAVLEQLSVRRSNEWKAEQWNVIRALEGRDRETNERDPLSGRWAIIISVLGNMKSPHMWAKHEPQLDEVLAELPSSRYVVRPDPHKQCVLVSIDAGIRGQALQDIVYRLHHAYGQTGANVHTAVVLKEGHERPDHAYVRAVSLLERQIRLESNTLSYMEAVSHPIDANIAWNHIRLLEAHLAKREMKPIRGQIDRIVSQIRTLKMPTLEIGQLMNDMFTALHFKLSQDRTYAIADMGEMRDMLTAITSYDELADWLEKQLMEFIRKTSGAGKEPKDLVHQLMNQIRHSYDRIDSLHQFASEHHISVSYLSRLFKTEAGMNFSDYVVHIRMEQAKRLLETETLSVAEVGEKVGYEDSKYFSQLFKKCTGMTPSEYKKSSDRSL